MITREKITRRKGQPTITEMVQEVAPGLFMQGWTVGENNFVVVLGDSVVRRGQFACASEAIAELKPVAPEQLFVQVGGRETTAKKA
jgi:hypothetical protein